MSYATVDRRNLDSAKPADSDNDLFITVFTDGSWCPDTKAYGYAVWIRDGQKPIHMFGAGGFGGRDSYHVESMGLAAAVKYILENCSVAERVLVIQCDNIGALNSLDVKQFKKLGAKFIKRKHVKAHTSHKTNRSKVNELVDNLAGQYMREYRAKVRGNA